MKSGRLDHFFSRAGTWLSTRLANKRQYRFCRTIAIFFDEQSLQIATARNLCHLSRLLDITKIYIPKSLDTPEKRWNFISHELKKYVAQFKSGRTRFVLGVGGSESAFRTISLPHMPKKELAKAIYFEGNKRIPFGLEQAYYGYQTIKKTTLSGDESIFASLLAVSKKEINRRRDLTEPLGIKPDAIHHELEAIGHLLPHIDGYDKSRTYALINIKARHSEISFYRNRRLEFMHISAVGSETLEELPNNQSRYEFFTETLVNEIQNSLDYYIGQFSNTSTDLVFVYGDLSYSDDLIDNLSKHFGIEFKRFPVEQMYKSQPHIKKFADQIPVSLSTVALATVNHEMIDFTPPKIKEKRADLKYLKYVIPSFLLFAATLLGWWMLTSYSNGVKSERLAAADSQIHRFEGSPSMIMYSQLKRQMVTDQAILNQLDREPTYLHLNLKELTRITPPQVKLDFYFLENDQSENRLTITGHAISSDPPPEIILAEYIVELESSPFYANVVLDRHVKKTMGKNFKIEFQLLMDAVI